MKQVSYTKKRFDRLLIRVHPYLDVERLEALEKEIEALKNSMPEAPVETPVFQPPKNGAGPDLAQLMGIFASKNPPDNTIKRIYDLEQLMSQVQKRLDGMDDALSGLSNLEGVKDLAQLVSDLVERVKAVEEKTVTHDDNLERHETDIEALKAAISGMGSGASVTGDIDSNQLLMRINMLSEELKRKSDRSDLEKLKLEMQNYTDSEINKLKKELNDSLEGIRFEIERLRAEFENFKNRDFSDLVNRVNTLEKKVSTLINTVGNIKIPDNLGNNSGVSEAAFKALEARVAALENELNDLRSEFSRWMKELQDSLNGKADLSSLTELEKLLMERLNEIVKALTKQFADKNETKRALKLLERQLKNLYDLFMSKGGNANEEDAMFSKKPLGGLSCASCEKDLVNMYGKRVEFMQWNKLPFRDPSERIARVGQGFSKMLSMINPDQL